MKPLGLRWHFYLYILLPLFTISGGLGFVALQKFESIVQDRMELDVRVVAHTFQPALGRLMSEEPPFQLQPLLSQAFEAEGDYGVFVYDLEGNIVARAGRFQNRSAELPATVPDLTDRNLSRHDGYSEVADESVYSYFAPLITEAGQVTGILQVARLRRNYEQFLTNLRRGAFSFFFLSALIMIGAVTVGFQRAIGGPLNRLNASMIRIQRGEREHRASPRGPREVVELSQTLNGMLNSIERAEQEIRTRQENERKLSERLKQSEKLASLGNIAAGVAHELGTPLSVVVGNAQRGLRHPDNPPKTQEALRGIQTEVARMDRIVRQLLEFGRAGGAEAKPVTPEHLAQSALSAIESIREQTGGKIVLGDTFPDRTVLVNPIRVELALINLLKNALQARPNGTVRFSWFAGSDGVTFEVADDGPGIEPENVAKIFEPFVSTKGPEHGVGLGLAIVAQVADECGGSVRVVSEKGRGSRFFLSIPFSEHDQ